MDDAPWQEELRLMHVFQVGSRLDASSCRKEFDKVLRGGGELLEKGVRIVFVTFVSA